MFCKLLSVSEVNMLQAQLLALDWDNVGPNNLAHTAVELPTVSMRNEGLMNLK